MGFFHTIILFDGFRSVRASLFGNTHRGWAIIKSRLCREAAKVGGGFWSLGEIKRKTDSHGRFAPPPSQRETGIPCLRARGTDSHASVHPKGTCFAASTGSE